MTAPGGPSIRRVERHLRGAGAARRPPLLLRRTWLPPAPRAVLALVHGYAEHSGRYEHFGAWFARRGLAVHGYDQRGHGRSEGPRCHVDRFGDYLDDLDRLLECVRAEHPGLPLVLVGHSMGGLVVASYLSDRRPPLAAAVLSGPLLALGPGVSRARQLAARTLRFVWPRLVLGSGLDPAGLSRDEEVVRRYVEDPLVERTMTAGLGAEILAAVPRAAARAFEIQVPVLVLHGAEDPMCPVEGSAAFHGGLQVPGSSFRPYPGLRHEIFNEPEHEQVFADVLAFVERTALRDERSPARGAAAASA